MHFLLRSYLVLALLTPWVSQAQTSVDLPKSSIIAGFKQMGVPVDGKFQKFVLDMQFDPSKPEQGQVRIDVDVASFDIGDDSYNKEVRSKTWFNASAYPKAQFVSSSIKQTAVGRYAVNGKLSIKGKTMEVSIPVVFRKEDTTHVFDGTLPIKRLQFNIGEQEWKDTSLVADEVQLKFHIVASAK
ncbi:YceI family protein [Undibacterium sp. SXout7W]|uniref:YceI family protein n=1 Tax=Undibacterium sp. SXout7W TaxID=3413049 RepID=UPI003BF3918F